MKKYKVMVEGRNFLIGAENEIRKHGFYTTRLIEARDEEEAESKAVEMLRNDPDLVALTRNERSDPPMMYVGEIEELMSFGGFNAPGSGFSWYPEQGDGG